MSDQAVRILFVPGIRPKPRPADHLEQLRRCLGFGYTRAGGAEEDAQYLTTRLDLVGWSYDFYGEHKEITEDLPAIERLLRDEDPEGVAFRQARSLRRRIVGWLYAAADYFPILGTAFSTRRMQTRVQEIKRYFSDESGAATQARAMLATAIRAAWDKNERLLIIGHSFGSVIAYDTLWELSREPDCRPVDMFMSMGSPLTMNFINSHLKGAHERGIKRYPHCINRWINLAAVGEVTALDRKLCHRFSPMLKLGLIDSIEDDLALVNRFYEGDYLNVHKCYGYMASLEFNRLLAEWVRA